MLKLIEIYRNALKYKKMFYKFKLYLYIHIVLKITAKINITD